MQYLSPFPGNKRTLIFKQKEEELRHAIKHGFNPEKLAKAAEKVRTAKLYLIKALRQSLESICKEDDKPDVSVRLKNINQEEEEWISVSVDEIIERYRH
ncbi:MAG: hypothetical protein ABFD91_05920 [Anaerohalosphaeraceae bacterium]